MDSRSSSSFGNDPVEHTRLPRRVVARYATGSLGTGGFATLPGLVLVYYLTDSLGVAALLAGVIVTLAKLWDVIIDPVIGGLSDRALARSGTRRGPMLIGAIGLPIAFVLTFAVPAGLPVAASTLWVLVAFIAAATFFSLFQVPYIALPAELTSGYQERTRLLTWRVVVLTLAILLFGAGGPELRGLFPADPLLGYLVMAIIAAVVLAIGLLVATSVAPRGLSSISPHPRPGVLSMEHYRAGLAVLRESQPFRALLLTFMLQGLATGLMLAGAQFVATWVLRDEGAVTVLFLSLIAPALVFAPVWRRIADRLGKERAFRLASLVFLIATLVLVGMTWAPGWWIVAPVAVAGAAYAGMQSLPLAMLPDVISVDRERFAEITPPGPWNARPTGIPVESRAGVFGGVWTAGETAGMALGATVLTLVLALSGYVESSAGMSVTQPAQAIAGISLSFSLLPAALMFLSLVTLRRYRLREHDVRGAAA
ncbi:MFS transporter [Leucobacter rhizosphaerae]|uniref:MFS transporter n=1 Tax=Leucobacter rhizosphaerae TaxID=2932245 RepID=A0ABY4FUY9_9MICO|nr:MFS transporter [Leucobacter rhizosphaerae]UOQ60131.1 MFS transporter [Leucobacter rhizosphaerae]